ncbi:hypothetical protein AB2C95_32215, partial [Pseudomonas aeruginosa]
MKKPAAAGAGRAKVKSGPEEPLRWPGRRAYWLTENEEAQRAVLQPDWMEDWMEPQVWFEEWCRTERDS